METYYKKKRKKAGLAQSDMAKELGIDYKKYNLIENGVVKMPSKLIDKFNEIVNKGENNHKLERLNNEQIVNEFWDEISQSTGKYGDYKLKEKMKEFNIDTFSELGQLLNISSSNLSHYLKSSKKTPYDIKNRVYLFFQDELNIQPPKEKSAVAKKTVIKTEKKKGTRGSAKQCHNQELIDYYNSLDLGAFIKEHNMTAQGLAREIGLHQDSIRRMITKETSIPSEKTIVKIKNFMEKYNKSTVANYYQVEPITETECVTTTASTLDGETQIIYDEFISPELKKCDEKPVENTEKCDNAEDIKQKYLQEIEENNFIIETYRDIINKLTVRNKVCEEVLSVIDELRGE